MKVSELIENLLEFPQDSEIVMSSDGEGNSYSPLAGINDVKYLAESTWSGHVFSPLEDDVPEEAIAAVLFYPVN